MAIRVRLILLIFSTSLCTGLFGQKTLVYDDPLDSYKKGLEFLKQKNYITAKRLFLHTVAQTPTIGQNHDYTVIGASKYYAALCALELEQPDAEKLFLDLIDTYYEDPYTRLAYYQLGRYYFANKNYSNAIEWFEKLDILDLSLSNEEIAEYKFQLAYCYFFKKKFDEAHSLFKEVRNVKNKYYYPANYYYGYTSFVRKEYDEALKSFDRIKDSKVYEKIIPYYISQIYYFKGKYQDLIDYLSPLMNDPQLKYYSELNQLLGQTYFKLKQYDLAIKYLNSYVSKSGRVTKEDIYRLGYSYYQVKSYEEAISQFEQLDHLSDSLGQHALYILANSYLSVNNKTNARGAFQRALRLDHDPVIVEQSKFNYAKLSYELGFDNEAINSLQEFIKAYPKSENQEEAKELLTELFLNTRNYQDALLVIESMKDKSPKVKRAYQEVAFYRGIELYNDKEFEQAISQFTVSLNNPVNAEIKAAAYYWTGESHYQQKDFVKAASNYTQYMDLARSLDSNEKEWLMANANYGTGYSYLKLDRFSQALIYFNHTVDQTGNAKDSRLKNNIYPDALLRSADCSFMVKEYNKSLNAYDELIKTNKPGADYALYQKGIIQGLQGKLEEKIKSLELIGTKYPGSIYSDDALYEIGTAYLGLGKNQSAIQTFNKVISNYPNSVYWTKSHLKLGLIYYNSDDVDEALTSYKKVIQAYPKSQDAQEALAGIKDISIAEGKPNLYLDLIKRIPDFQLTVSAEDSITYLAAESHFINGNCDLAISAYTDYLKDFKDAYFKLPAHFYLGECLYKKTDYEQAYANYSKVIAAGSSRFLENALVKAAKIKFEIDRDYEKAYNYFRLLSEKAAYKENLYLANLGLMRCSYFLQKHEDVAKYASLITSSGQASPDHIIEANFYLGKVAFENKDYDNAVKLFEKTVKATTGVKAAESKYLIAEISYLTENFEQSIKGCFDVIEQFPSYEYWRVKSFILLSDNYHQLDNLFQAKATLQSIIDNYKGEELRNIAQEKLRRLQAEEAAASNIKIYEDTGSIFEADTTEEFELIAPENMEEEEE